LIGATSRASRPAHAGAWEAAHLARPPNIEKGKRPMESVNPLTLGAAAGAGFLVFVASMAMILLSRFYRRCGADDALVRTGGGGNKVVIGGGVMVYPIFHQLLRVSLRSVKLSVERAGKNALVTA